jgi:hypothetical protein
LAAVVVWGICFGQMASLSRHSQPWLRRSLLALFSIYPAFVHQSVVPLTHLPVACCLLGLASGMQRAPTWWRGLGLGLLLGIAALFRPGVLALGPILVGWWVWRYYAGGVRAWVALALLLVGVSLPIGLWRSQAPALHGSQALINTATPYNFFIGNQPETPRYRTWWLGSHDERDDPRFASYYARLAAIRQLPASQQSAAFLHHARGYIAQAPGAFLRRTWNRGKVFWAFDTLAGATVSRDHPRLGPWLIAMDAACYLLLLLAVLTRLCAGDWQRGEWLLLALAYSGPYWLAFSHPTYHLPVLPLLGGWLLSNGPWRWPQGRQRWGWGAILLACLAIQVEWAWSWLG